MYEFTCCNLRIGKFDVFTSNMIIFWRQAQVNGQWKRIRRSQLVQANIAGTQQLKIIRMQRRYGADMEFKHERPYLVLIIHVPNY